MFELGPVQVHFGARSGKYPDGNQVIVRGRDTVAAFDTPLVANHIGPAFDGVDMVILGHVHEDHMAGLHRVPDAKVFAHAADLAAAQSWDGLARHYGYEPGATARLRIKLEQQFFYTPRPDCAGYEDGATWDLGGVQVRAIHMPGHTSGHCALLVEPPGVVFIGDIDLSSFGPYYGDATSSLRQFRETLAHIEAVPARVWVTSHHRGVITDRQVFLAQLQAFRDKLVQREERLLELLLHGPRTLDSLVQSRLLYPPDFEEIWVDDAERRSIRQHLDELLAAGRVRCDERQHYHRT